MSDTASIGLVEAARRLRVPVRVLRMAIRTGKVPAPANLTATSPLSAEWFASAETAADALDGLRRTINQRVPAFARYKGTSAWRKYSNRVREYAHFRKQSEHA